MYYFPYYYWIPPCCAADRQQPTPLKAPPPHVKLHEASLTYPSLTGVINYAVGRKLNTAIRDTALSLIQTPTPSTDVISAASKYDLKVLKNNIISIRFENYIFERHYAHGMTYVSSITANTQTGQVYQFADLFNPTSIYKAVLTRLIQQQIANRQIQLINPYNGIKGDESFYLTETNLVIYYPIYEYTPYYYGVLEFSIPYQQIQSIINPQGPIALVM
jgi:hypothetical protein